MRSSSVRVGLCRVILHLEVADRGQGEHVSQSPYSHGNHKEQRYVLRGCNDVLQLVAAVAGVGLSASPSRHAVGLSSRLNVLA